MRLRAPPAPILNRLFTVRLKNSHPRAQGRAVWIPPVNDLKPDRSLSVQHADVGMTSDMTWQARGGRPQPLQAALEAARRSGMSVGEWLDSVIQESAHQESARPESARQHEALPPRRDGDRRREAGDDRRRREDPAPPEPYAEVSAKLDTLSQQLERLAATSAAIGVSKPHRDDDQIASALSQLDRRLEQLMDRRPRAGESERPAFARPVARRWTPHLG